MFMNHNVKNAKFKINKLLDDLAKVSMAESYITKRI